MAALLGTVLIIDDDPDVQEVLKDRLESLGYRAVPALSGKQGLALLDEESPEMVFLDIELPDMNGLEALQAIRKRQNSVAVVIITAYGTIERAVQAMRDGAYDFIQKPSSQVSLRSLSSVPWSVKGSKEKLRSSPARRESATVWS